MYPLNGSYNLDLSCLACVLTISWYVKISNLKLVLERKEAELEQLKNRTNIRGGVSPLRLPKLNSNATSKPETSQQQFDTHSTEVPAKYCIDL